MSLPKRKRVTWDMFSADVDLMCEGIKKRHAETPFAGIVAIARGGFVPAGIVAHRIGVRMMDVVCIESYSNEEEPGPALISKFPNSGFEHLAPLLVVDDICDTGKTFKVVRNFFPKAFYAAVYCKPRGRKQLDAFGRMVEPDVWTEFPWELYG